MKTVFKYLKPYIPRMTLGLAIKFFGTVMDLLLPMLLGYIIDEVTPLGRSEPIIFWGVVMALCALTAVTANIIANRMAGRVARNTTQALRHDLFAKIIRLSCAQVDEVSIPSLEARLTSDTYNIHQMVGMMQRLGVRAPILLVGGILITLAQDPVLTLVLIAVLPFVALVVWRVSKRGIPLYTDLQRAVDGLVLTVRENFAGIRIIKALSKTEYEKERFDNANRTVVDREKKAGVTMAFTNPMMNVLLNLGLVLVIIVGAYRVNAGLSQVGTIIAFLSYFTLILNAMLSITRMFVVISKGAASAGRLSEVLNLNEDLVVSDGKPVEVTESVPHIEFRGVSFSYHKQTNNLTDISFSLNRGETLGIIGATGSGKSTLIHLLMRLYDADSGGIFINGQPIQSITNEKLHTMFGVVFQNDTLFADTIAENIDFGRELSAEQIAEAARMAQAAPFIEALPDRYRHQLTSKATNLSGGQKQRVLISRALAARPDILILDDSSSALDYKTDAALRQAVKKEYAGITTVIIAQRISSILHADHILVLEEGAILGCGTHKELLRSCPMYQQIYNTQMGGGHVA